MGQVQKNQQASSCEILPLHNTHLHALYHIALHCIAQYLCAIICALIYIQQAHRPILTQKNQPLASSMKQFLRYYC